MTFSRKNGRTYRYYLCDRANKNGYETVCIGEAPCPEQENLSPRQQIGSVPYAVQAEACVVSFVPLVRAGDQQISLGGVFRGTTGQLESAEGSFDQDGKTTGHIEYSGAHGYRAAKFACEAAIGSSTAHICSMQEMIISEQLGMLVGCVGREVHKLFSNWLSRARRDDEAYPKVRRGGATQLSASRARNLCAESLIHPTS